MELKIKIELLEADTWSFIKDKAVPPDGITVEGPIGTQLCAPGSSPVATYLLVTITALGGFAATVAKDVLAKKAADWITEYLKRHRAKRVRINGRDAKPETISRVLREEFQGGKDEQVTQGDGREGAQQPQADMTGRSRLSVPSRGQNKLSPVRHRSKRQTAVPEPKKDKIVERLSSNPDKSTARKCSR